MKLIKDMTEEELVQALTDTARAGDNPEHFKALSYEWWLRPMPPAEQERCRAKIQEMVHAQAN